MEASRHLRFLLVNPSFEILMLKAPRATDFETRKLSFAC
ncbi:hypothetical protein VCRA212O16_80073 [Vibrio crassostreae]|nr:hypothetical protein VCRA212O16_80073 [Vibrio crassostreae]